MNRKFATRIVAGVLVFGVGATSSMTALANTPKFPVPVYTHPIQDPSFERAISLQPLKAQRLPQYAFQATYLNAVTKRLSQAVEAGDAKSIQSISATAARRLKTVDNEASEPHYALSPPVDEKSQRFVQRLFSNAPEELGRLSARLQKTGKPANAEKYMRQAVSTLEEISSWSAYVVEFQKRKEGRSAEITS